MTCWSWLSTEPGVKHLLRYNLRSLHNVEPDGWIEYNLLYSAHREGNGHNYSNNIEQGDGKLDRQTDRQTADCSFSGEICTWELV